MRDDAVATFDLPTVLRFSELALAALGAAREEIDALNVYPVPDGDTGTNMFLTLEAARTALLDAVAGTHRDLAGARRPAHRDGRVRPGGAAGGPRQLRGDLLLARRARCASGWARPVPATVPRRSSPRAWRWPPRPATPRSASRSRARSCRWPGPPPRPRPRRPRTRPTGSGHVIRAAAAAAREALARTPDQLQVLHDAGVVDAGGRGLCVVLDAAETAVTGRRPVSAPPAVRLPGDPGPAAAPGARGGPDRPTVRPTR